MSLVIPVETLSHVHLLSKQSVVTYRQSAADIERAQSEQLVQLRIMNIDSDEVSSGTAIALSASTTTRSADDAYMCTGEMLCNNGVTMMVVILCVVTCLTENCFIRRMSFFAQRQQTRLQYACVHHADAFNTSASMPITYRCYRRKLMDVRFNRVPEAIAAFDDLSYLHLISGKHSERPRTVKVLPRA
eukprot:14172-Heterococcus_DN1.PRE.1